MAASLVAASVAARRLLWDESPADSHEHRSLHQLVRVHLVDSYPRDLPHNFLFRGNTPVNSETDHFDEPGLRAAITEAALRDCGVTVPPNFKIIMLDLQNPSDPNYLTGISHWETRPNNGSVVQWLTTGSIVQPQHSHERATRVESGDWAMRGHADYLAPRLAATRQYLMNVADRPTVLYVHCQAGCDRTGQFIGAYAMTYLGYNTSTMYGEACRQCGYTSRDSFSWQCPNYFSTAALGWWCLTLAARGTPVQGDCLDFATCEILGECEARSPTPLVGRAACPGGR